MPMITCSECGGAVSTAAKSCPGCGAAARVFRKPKKQPMSRRRKIGIAGATAGAVLLMSVLGNGPTTAAPKTAEDLTNDARMRAAYFSVNALKRSLREPGSAVFEAVQVDESAGAVCLTYRAQNGFGGISREHLVYVDGEPSQRRSTWNRHCARKMLYDYTGLARL